MMPKRTNPFGENSPLQYKTHVGKKEINLGVNMEKNMETVYEKTKSLLYEGSKKALDCSVCGENPEWSSIEGREQALYPLPGQMKLNQEGKLCDKVKTMSENKPEQCSDQMEIELPLNVNCSKESSSKQSPGKQLQIGTDGKLHSASVVPSHPVSSSGFCICHSCNRPTNMNTRKCYFCDRLTCNSCINQCVLCKGLFCQVCSVLNYDDFIEQPYCLQCFGKNG